MNLSDVDLLLNPVPLPLEMGIQRLDSGVLHVASRTDMHNCKGRMLDWWFGWFDNSKQYAWWYPVDHIFLKWDDSRKPGAYMGSTCLADEKLGGDEVYRLHIHFHNPSELFNAQKLAKAYESGDVSAIVCAQIGFGDNPPLVKGRPVGGRLIHVARDTLFGCVLRSRFWLGDGLNAPPEVIREQIPDSLGLALMRHAYNEYTVLSRSLPSLYYGENKDKYPLQPPW